MMNGAGTWREGKEGVLWLKDPLDAVRRALWGPGWKQGGGSRIEMGLAREQGGLSWDGSG